MLEWSLIEKIHYQKLVRHKYMFKYTIQNVQIKDNMMKIAYKNYKDILKFKNLIFLINYMCTFILYDHKFCIANFLNDQ